MQVYTKPMDNTSLTFQFRNTYVLISTDLEYKKGGSGSLSEELQEVWHHHFSAVRSIALLSSTQISLFLVASPAMEVAHGLVHGERNREKALLLLAVKHISDFLELKRCDSLSVFILLQEWMWERVIL